MPRMDRGHEIEAAHSGHFDIGDDQIKTVFGDLIKRALGGCQALDGITLLLQHLNEIVHDARVIIHDEKAFGYCTHGCSLWGCSGGPLTGRSTLNRLPLSTVDSTESAPPCSVTMDCTTARPKPVPPSPARVVKNGSNKRPRVSGDMPQPVSATMRRAVWTSRPRARIRS